MKYLIMGLIVTLALTTFLFAMVTSAVYVEVSEWLSRTKFGRRGTLD